MKMKFRSFVPLIYQPVEVPNIQITGGRAQKIFGNGVGGSLNQD